MTTYVFPGQGSQTLGMGKELFQEFPEYLAKANTILGYDLADLCLNNPNQQLNITNYTQPALYVVNALNFIKKKQETPQLPDYVAGHSLGEYNALFAASVFDFETGLKLVQKRGELMSKAKDGGMAAVIGLSSEDVKSIIQQHNLENLSIANFNSCKQIVISGAKNAIDQAQTVFETAGADMYIPLKVSGAFHSPLMEDAKQQYEVFLQNFHFYAPSITVIANVDAKPYTQDTVRSLLAKQITHSVLWTQSIEYLITKGETLFEELGPGKVLTGLIKRIQQGK
jgi:malonyl CoA-acyl carrier protein transacylase